jgi:hypothetical protein
MTANLLRTYDRRGQVPAHPRLSPSVCKGCKGWFARPPRFSRCFGCTTVKSRFTDALTMATPAAEPVADVRSGPGGEPLYLALARVAALRIDCPNVRKEDLKPEWRGFWDAGQTPARPRRSPVRP